MGAGVSDPTGALGDFLRVATANVRSADVSSAQRLRESVAGLKDAMAGVFAETVRAGDPKGYAEAVVDLRGRLLEMHISPYGLRLSEEQLSAACMAAFRAAAQAAGELLPQRLTDVMGVQPGADSFEEAIPAEMRSWAEVDEIRRAGR